MNQILRASSRSIINDICYEKCRSQSMLNHKRKLSHIRNQHRSTYDNIQYKHRLKLLKKYKSETQKVDHIFDPVHNENSSLLAKLTTIKDRRSEHGRESQKLLQNYRITKEKQQVQLRKQNQKLINKILQQKSKISTKKLLKRQFKQYETMKQKIRKSRKQLHSNL